MNSSKWILIFGIFFSLSLVSVRYEKYVLKTVMEQKALVDRRAELAGNAAAENLKKGIYEPGALETAKTVFQYTYSALGGDEGSIVFTAEINGEPVTEGKALAEAVRGDRIDLCFELPPVEIRAPGRRMTYKKILVKTVYLD